MRYADRAQAETAAYEILIKYGDGKLPVDVVPALKACRRARVMTYEEAVKALGIDEGEFNNMAASDAAFVVRREGALGAEFLLLTSAKGARTRERFSLAHELGHIVMAHDADDRASETEANAFASAFLCPRPILRRLDIRRACEVAAAFDISLAAADIALSDISRPQRAAGSLQDALLRRFDAYNRQRVEDYMDLNALARFYMARLGRKKSPPTPVRRAEHDKRIDTAVENMERLIEIRMDGMAY